MGSKENGARCLLLQHTPTSSYLQTLEGLPSVEPDQVLEDSGLREGSKAEAVPDPQRWEELGGLGDPMAAVDLSGFLWGPPKMQTGSVGALSASQRAAVGTIVVIPKLFMGTPVLIRH